MSPLRKLLILPPVLAGVALLVWSTGTREEPERAAPGEGATRAAILTVAPQPVVPRVRGFGTVAPARTWRAVPQVAGRIAEIHPELIRGGTVAEGELLLRIAPETYEAALAEAEASIARAEAELSELELTRETTLASLRIERDALALAERDLERQRSLAARDTVAQSTVDAQERAVLEQRARVQDLENQLRLLPARIEALTQSRRVAEANRDIARLDLERTEIRAPFDARVASADAQVEQFVAAGSAVAVLDGVASAEIDAQIPPARMAGFVRLAAGPGTGQGDAPGGASFAAVAARLDLSASVRLATGEGLASWQAEVLRISDTVDPETRSVGVIVAVADPYGNVVPGRRPPLIKGMFVEVELAAAPIPDRVLVPRSAVREGRVMVADAEDRLAFMAVEVVHTLGETAVLAAGAAGGLAPGTRVVVSDLSPAIEGMLLEPEEDAAAAALVAAAARPDAPGAAAGPGSGGGGGGGAGGRAGTP